MDVALDYCGRHGGTFSTWFPIAPLADAAPLELDLHKLVHPVEMKLGYSSPPSSAPCIHLSMTYEPEQSSFVLGHVRSYVSVVVGELALSLSAPVSAMDHSKDNTVETHEMLRISFAGIDVKCLTSSKQCQWTVDLDSFQVDNQRSAALNQTDVPVMVSRASHEMACGGTAKPVKPLLQAVVITHPRKDQQQHVDTSSSSRPTGGSPTNSTGRRGGPTGLSTDTAARHITHIELVALSIDETDWTFDEVMLRTLYDVCERLYDKHQPVFGSAIGAGASPVGAVVAPAIAGIASVYIARLDVRPFKCNVTFRKSTSYAPTTAAAMPNTHRKAKFMHSFVAAIFNLANTIENAPLEFNALRLDHEITDFHHLQDHVFQHYTTNVLRQLYKLIGTAHSIVGRSMNFMGNPVGLAANVAGGVRDFVVQPYAGLTSGGPSGLVRGLTKGTASLLGHTAFGLFDTTSRMTGAMGNTVVAFSRDRVFKAKRNVYALARPTTRRDQLRLDIQKLKHDVCSGIIGGLTGLVLDPIRGGRRGGLRGFAGGVAQGLSGVLVKPVVGAIDLATHVVEGARDVAGLAFGTKKTAFDKLRKRMSHVFGADGRLLPHDASEIWSTAVVAYLHATSRQQHATSGVHKVTDMDPPMQLVWATAFKTDVGRVSLVVVRKCELLCAEISTANWQQPRLLWRVPTDRVAFVERVAAVHLAVHFRRSVEDQARPFKVAKTTPAKRGLHRPRADSCPSPKLCKIDGSSSETCNKDDIDDLDTVEVVVTAAWEDARHFERDAAKMAQLVAVLRHQYAFVGSIRDDVDGDGDDASERRTKWVVDPPTLPSTTALQQFAFQRLHVTQETLKTQYCVNDEDLAKLERCPWTEFDGHDAVRLWAGCADPPSNGALSAPAGADAKKAGAKPRAPSLVTPGSTR
ncbi:hypothetical protein DYB32_008923 [Aphanomyces invadans]|uniref:Uncharacterized protein n=1 Tax=Aphanomyces invadans TaxID=157072 RepID=A0A418AK35_9STRA|nr:hypothetical protein DYB32_008923 [Aphanomyces invadans]